jgi:signal peptidase I
MNNCNTVSAEIPTTGSAAIGAGDTLLPPVGKPGAHTPSFLQQIYQCVSIAALAMASYFVISHFVLQSVQVVGESMYPTLQDSQHYLLNRWVYLVRAPQRTDVVVIRDPLDNTFAVKRIIGMAGDSIYLKGGQIYVNGQKLEEPYLSPGTPTYTYSKLSEQLVKCGKDQYFVLGDNRKNSTDSRTYGLVPRQRILGLIVR